MILVVAVAGLLAGGQKYGQVIMDQVGWYLSAVRTVLSPVDKPVEVIKTQGIKTQTDIQVVLPKTDAVGAIGAVGYTGRIAAVAIGSTGAYMYVRAGDGPVDNEIVVDEPPVRGMAQYTAYVTNLRPIGAITANGHEIESKLEGGDQYIKVGDQWLKLWR